VVLVTTVCADVTGAATNTSVPNTISNSSDIDRILFILASVLIRGTNHVFIELFAMPTLAVAGRMPNASAFTPLIELQSGNSQIAEMASC